jgi:hypothetical protein
VRDCGTDSYITVADVEEMEVDLGAKVASVHEWRAEEPHVRRGLMPTGVTVAQKSYTQRSLARRG